MQKRTKITYIFLYIAVVLLFCGFSFKQPKNEVLLGYEPITQDNIDKACVLFKTGHKIHYTFLIPKGFKDDFIRIQVMKKDDKSEFWGYKYQTHYDFKIEEDGKLYITDYIVLHKKGFYFVQFFNLENINKPLALGEFWVK